MPREYLKYRFPIHIADTCTGPSMFHAFVRYVESHSNSGGMFCIYCQSYFIYVGGSEGD